MLTGISGLAIGRHGAPIPQKWETIFRTCSLVLAALRNLLRWGIIPLALFWTTTSSNAGGKPMVTVTVRTAGGQGCPWAIPSLALISVQGGAPGLWQ